MVYRAQEGNSTLPDNLVCRVSTSLPSAIFQGLGKEALCRVQKKSANRLFVECKKNTRQTSYLPSVYFLTFDKESVCQVFF
jgi:hypothetical protein